MAKKINIIGAGLSGCVLARLFAEAGWIVNLYEKKNYIAGHCYDFKNEKGVLIHKYGPHIFHTSNEKVWNFVNRFTKFNNYINKVLVNVNDKLIQMPINLNSIKALFPDQYEYFVNKIKLFFNNKTAVSISELLSVKDQTIAFIANFVYENIYQNYTKKMWGKWAGNLDNAVLERVKINLNEQWNYFINDKYQGLPIEGYNIMFEKMIDHNNINLVLNFDAVTKISFHEKKVTFNNQDDIIIYSGMIDYLLNYKFGNLPYRSLLIKFKTYKKNSYQDVAVINYPSDLYMTRISEYKKMTFQKSNYTTISKEFPGEYDKNSLDFNTPFYPINNEQTNDLFNKYFSETKKYYNLYLIGRLGLYKYFDMDDCIEQCFQLFDTIIKKN